MRMDDRIAEALADVTDPTEIRLSRDANAELLRESVYIPIPPVTYFGIPVVVDRDLPPDTIRIVTLG